MRSEMEKIVPSTSLTIAVSDLGPESSTVKMDLAESFKIMSNSADVTDGILAVDAGAAYDEVGNRSRVEDDALRIFNRKFLRRDIIIMSLSVFDSSCSASFACNLLSRETVVREFVIVGTEKECTAFSPIARSKAVKRTKDFILVS
jgi:hypothetical protein